VVRAIEAIHPEVVVVASPREDALRALVAPLSRVSGGVRVAIGGAGATPDVARRMGALLLDDDPVSAAARVASHSSSGADSR
jgi:hypothetical protein